MRYMALAGRAVVIDPAKHPLSSTSPPPPTMPLLSSPSKNNVTPGIRKLTFKFIAFALRGAAT